MELQGGVHGVRAFEEVVLRHSADAALLLHPVDGVVYASPAMEYVTGLPASEFLGILAADWVHTDDVDHAIQQRHLATLAGHSGPTVIRGRHGSGGYRRFEAEWWHLATEHTVLHLRDVEERCKIIDRLTADLATAQARLRELGADSNV